MVYGYYTVLTKSFRSEVVWKSFIKSILAKYFPLQWYVHSYYAYILHTTYYIVSKQHNNYVVMLKNLMYGNISKSFGAYKNFFLFTVPCPNKSKLCGLKY